MTYDTSRTGTAKHHQHFDGVAQQQPRFDGIANRTFNTTVSILPDLRPLLYMYYTIYIEKSLIAKF